MSTTGTGSHWQVVTDDQSGTPLSNITSLSYTTNTNDSGNTLDPSLQLVINPGNTTRASTPASPTRPSTSSPTCSPTPVVSGTWQTWNVMNGVVWGTHLTGAPNSAPISWSTFIADYPNATILPVSIRVAVWASTWAATGAR